MLWPKVSPSTLMFLPEASWKPLSAWQARQSACANTLMGTKAINSTATQPMQNVTEIRFLAPFRIPHQTSPELLRFRSVPLFDFSAHGAIEEAVSAALLILASSFSPRLVVTAGLSGRASYVCPYGEGVRLTGIAL